MNNEKENSPSLSSPPVAPPVIKEELTKENHSVPEYLQAVYHRRYFSPFLSKIFDDDWISGPGTFFCTGKLTKAVTNEIIEGNDVLQLGIASGTFERDVASKMNSKGRYHIEDISPSHGEAVMPRISPWLNATIKERDFTIENEWRYDIVIGYFVLHELPDIRKKALLKRALNALKPTGKMIFIDYAQPNNFHP